MQRYWSLVWLCCLMVFCSSVSAEIPYGVKFTGVQDAQLLTELRSVSKLISLQKSPPASEAALRFRISSDIPPLLSVLQAYGYFDAKVYTTIKENKKPFQVIIQIDGGPRYVLHDILLNAATCPTPTPIDPISFQPMGITKGNGLNFRQIDDSKFFLLKKLSERSYPLAKIEKEEVLVDKKEKNIDLSFCVDTGPKTRFGATTLIGLKKVKPGFITHQIRWHEDDYYSPRRVEETQELLLLTNLFSSVAISHAKEIDENGSLPMKIQLTEAKHKSIAAGISYATVDGFGTSFSWSFRNFRGLGETISLNADIAQTNRTGQVYYKSPNFIRYDQEFVSQATAEREDIYPYTAETFTWLNRIDRKLSKRMVVSGGIQFEVDNISHSAHNGDFGLVGLPIYLKYSTANNLLNPTKGYTLIYRATPYTTLKSDGVHFLKQMLTGQYYFPLIGKNWLILALRIQAGSIVGENLYNIPMTKLFLGGADDDLRGYRYRTVSALDGDNKPIGGRSAIFTTIEPRIQISEHIGIVPFFDAGTVTSSEIPTVYAKWYKSYGIGLRYYSFFGPIRADIAFPLDKRPNVDRNFRIYVSIGQTF